MTIGERIKEVREKRGMTQEDSVAILLQIKKGDGQEHGKKKGGKQKPMNLPPPT